MSADQELKQGASTKVGTPNYDWSSSAMWSIEGNNEAEQVFPGDWTMQVAYEL